jgi:hypothetical protein
MKELSEKEYAKAMLKTIKWEKCDTKKRRLGMKTVKPITLLGRIIVYPYDPEEDLYE